MSALHNALNNIPSNIKKNLDFLELGYNSSENIGNNFKDVDGFKSKDSVDMNNSQASYFMTTDDFFTQNKKIYDIIYIDAGHYWENVLADYNNSIKALKPGGIIFFHDLFPTPELATPQYCWDGYKILNYFKYNNYKFLTYKPDVGTTFVYNSFEPIDKNNIEQITYEEFIQNMEDCDKICENFDVWSDEFIKLLCLI